MKVVELGNSGIRVAPLALGGNVFGWTIDEKTSFGVLDAFVDAGCNLVDTANIYSTWVPGHQGGESESIIGNWLAASGKRAKTIVATKVGMQMGDGGQGLKRDYIVKECEKSLRRLRIDCIDLYQSHKDDPDTPLEETLAAFDRLIRQGKVRAIGASNFDAKRLADALTTSKAHKIASYVSLQPEYNLYDRAGFEAELEPLCLGENVGVISYYSLASGFLTGKYRSAADSSKSVRGGGMAQKYLNPRGFRILKALDDVAAAKGETPAAIALAWLMQRKSVTAPIASVTSARQLSELLKAVEVSLSLTEVNALDEASAY